jgi:hypothetical protein
MEVEALLRTEAYSLGLGCAAQVEYRQGPPPDAPRVGAEWSIDLDRPAIIAYLTLPTREGRLDPSLQSPRDVFGEPLSQSWGQRLQGGKGRRLLHRVIAASRSEALSAARAYVATQIEVLRTVTRARATRLAQRDATIAAWFDDVGPAEQDLTIGEQRFRLLELDDDHCIAEVASPEQPLERLLELA